MKVLLFMLATASALNILISSTDSWVSKNTRFLYQSLKEQNHTVILAAPLHQDSQNSHDTSHKRNINTNNNGGDFGHLLPVHQTFYKNSRKIATLPRSAKSVIRKRDSDSFDASVARTVATSAYGQDPLDHDVWYVDRAPVLALLLAYDVILPTHYPNFAPDLVILGPNEGLSDPHDLHDLSFTNHLSSLHAMTTLSQLKGFPVLSVSLQDDHHIYYQDENYFKIQQQNLHATLKRNVIGQNIEFVNAKVSELVTALAPSLRSDTNHAQLAINVNFPSINFDRSHCSTTNAGFSANQPKSNPQFTQIVAPATASSLMRPFDKVSVPLFQLNDSRDVVQNGHYQISLDENLAIHSNFSSPVDEPSTFVDKRSYYYQQKVKLSTTLPEVDDESVSSDVGDNQELHIAQTDGELNALNHCMIAVSVGHINLGNGLGTDVFDLQSVF